MTEQERGEKLHKLEEEYEKIYRKVKKYRILLKGATDRLQEILKEIEEI